MRLEKKEKEKLKKKKMTEENKGYHIETPHISLGLFSYEAQNYDN